ncbi:ABC transporter permease [Micromonospora endophytica]|uniref:Peptide ABC transporter permease n=1 Tax=Micromonospora endophytica TaxID=515350 RepID=A0A2W2CTM0_9ACTN|nr:ABC transporter permease [Micromonospora endophytica]PZG01201.1 peptide ABC transporter permease [Micromonospora endophytica]RIW45858.1 ABC transporter permease [Micromonospora endophytica]
MTQPTSLLRHQVARSALLRQRPGQVIAAVVLSMIVLAAIVPGLFTDGLPYEADPLATLQPPSLTHPFGTDANGRDVFTRVVYGARHSLLAGLGAVALAVTVGTLLGLIAGLGGRIADEIIMRLVDVTMSLPNLLLAMLVLTLAGPGALNSIYAIAIYIAPGYARLVRVQTMVIRRSEYVQAATALGLRRARVVLAHIVPNAFVPLLVLATIEVGTALVAAASLSFLGLGARPPAPEWGAMLAAGRDYFSVAWWTAVFPGLAITFTVLAITVVGGALQRRLEGLDGPEGGN